MFFWLIEESISLVASSLIEGSAYLTPKLREENYLKYFVVAATAQIHLFEMLRVNFPVVFEASMVSEKSVLSSVISSQ